MSYYFNHNTSKKKVETNTVDLVIQSKSKPIPQEVHKLYNKFLYGLNWMALECYERDNKEGADCFIELRNFYCEGGG